LVISEIFLAKIHRQHQQARKAHSGTIASQSDKYQKMQSICCRKSASLRTKTNAAPIHAKARMPQPSMNISATSFLRRNRLKSVAVKSMTLDDA
jgi:hypothetical protein